MAVSYGPKLGLIINALTGDTYDVALRALLRSLDQLQFLHVKSRIVAAPPGSPANGDAYIVGPSATGAGPVTTNQSRSGRRTTRRRRAGCGSSMFRMPDGWRTQTRTRDSIPTPVPPGARSRAAAGPPLSSD